MPEDQELASLVKQAHDLLGYNQSNEFLLNLHKSKTFEKHNLVEAALILRNLLAQTSGKPYLSTSIDDTRKNYSPDGAMPEGGSGMLKKIGYTPGVVLDSFKSDSSNVKDFEWSEMHMESIKAILADGNLAQVMNFGSANSASGFETLKDALASIQREILSWGAGYAPPPPKASEPVEPAPVVKARGRR